MTSTPRPRSRIALLIAVFVLTAGAASLPVPGIQAQESGQTEAVAEPAPPEGRQPGPQDLLVQGNVTHAETGEALAGVEIEIFNRWISEEDGERSMKGYHETTVTTGPNGSYSVNVSRGHLQLSIDEADYQRVHASFEIEENLTLDLEMRPANDDLATLSGRITDRDGQGLADAHVNVRPVSEHRCEGDVCYATEPARDGNEVRQETVVHVDDRTIVIHYDARTDRHAWTDTEEDGTYTVRVPSGDYVVRASAREHVAREREITLDDGEDARLDLALTAIPPSSVTVEGTIVDAETGEPIPYAAVTVENDRWGAWNHTRTDEDGRFSVDTKPGHLVVTAQAERTYWVPCEDERRAAGSTSADEPVRHHPRCDGQRERAQGYFSRVMTFAPAAGETVEADASLERAPAPDASFSGWVINASSEEGIPNATVGFHNELTNEWGRAETDANGSFTIDVRAGYYTIRVHHPEHLSTATNAEIASGDAQRITLEVPPGQPRHGGCCIAYAEDARATGAAMEADGVGASVETSNAASGDDGPRGPESSPQGPHAFQGSGGGLGPYVASHADGSPGSTASTPLVSVLGTLAMLGLGAAALKLYRPRRE